MTEGFQALIQSLLPQTPGIFSVLCSNRSRAAEKLCDLSRSAKPRDQPLAFGKGFRIQKREIEAI
jgi:hypothetical protein